MTDSRKKHGIVFWPVAVATGLLFYVLSSGPVNWLTLKGYLPSGTGTFLYAPLFWVFERCPESTQTAFVQWLSIWHPSDWDEKLEEQVAEALADEVFNGMADNFAALGGADDEDNGEGLSRTDEAARRTFSLATKDGTLVVTVNDPDTAVQVFKEECKIEITRKSETSPLTIFVDPDEHSLKVEREQSTFSGKSFELNPGSKQGIAAKLVPLEEEAALNKGDMCGTCPLY